MRTSFYVAGALMAIVSYSNGLNLTNYDSMISNWAGIDDLAVLAQVRAGSEPTQAQKEATWKFFDKNLDG